MDIKILAAQSCIEGRTQSSQIDGKKHGRLSVASKAGPFLKQKHVFTFRFNCLLHAASITQSLLSQFCCPALQPDLVKAFSRLFLHPLKPIEWYKNIRGRTYFCDEQRQAQTRPFQAILTQRDRLTDVERSPTIPGDPWIKILAKMFDAVTNILKSFMENPPAPMYANHLNAQFNNPHVFWKYTLEVSKTPSRSTRLTLTKSKSVERLRSSLMS